MSAPAPTIKSWSFSALQQYERCPYSAKLARIDKLPRPELGDDHPMIRGSRIHTEIENFIRTGEAIPTPLKYQKDLIQQARDEFLAGNALIEEDWAYDKEWELADWSSSEAWLRAKLDAMWFEPEHTAWIVDWKSGKSWNKEVAHTQQGQLYSVCAFRRFPDLQKVKASFVYVDEPKTKDTPKIYTREQAQTFEISFHNRAVRMTSDTEFHPKPTQMNCRWCDFGTNAGTGACPYDRFLAEPREPETGRYRIPNRRPAAPAAAPALPAPVRNAGFLIDPS